MKERTILYADDGKVLTDGTVFGKQIFLAEGAEKTAFYEIEEAEYEKLLEETENREVH